MMTLKTNKKTKPFDRPLSTKRKQDVSYLNSQITLYTNSVNRSDAEANSTDRGLSSQLILITTVLITANIVVFSNGELMKLLSSDQKIITIFGCNMLVLSLLFGITYYSVVKKFHADWSTAKDHIAKSISKGEALTQRRINELVQKHTNKLQPQIRSHHLNFQITLLVLALLAYVALVTSLLLDIQFEDVPSLITAFV